MDHGLIAIATSRSLLILGPFGSLNPRRLVLVTTKRKLIVESTCDPTVSRSRQEHQVRHALLPSQTLRFKPHGHSPVGDIDLPALLTVGQRALTVLSIISAGTRPLTWPATPTILSMKFDTLPILPLISSSALYAKRYLGKFAQAYALLLAAGHIVVIS